MWSNSNPSKSNLLEHFFKSESATETVNDIIDIEHTELKPVNSTAPVDYHDLPQRAHAIQAPDTPMVPRHGTVPLRCHTQGGKGPLLPSPSLIATPISAPIEKSTSSKKRSRGRERTNDIPRPSSGIATTGSGITYYYGNREEMEKVVENKRAVTKENQQCAQRDDEWEDDEDGEENMVGLATTGNVHLQTLQKGLPKPKALEALDMATLIYRDQVPQMFEAMFRKAKKIRDETAIALQVAYEVKAKNLQEGLVKDNNETMIEIERKVEVGGNAGVVKDMVPRIPYADKRGIIGPWHPAIPHSINNMEKHGRKARAIQGETDPNGRLAGRLLVQWHRKSSFPIIIPFRVLVSMRVI
jgi:hypothetical protein